MLVMVREDMFAHKLMAMAERVGKTSRDIYDVWFFLKNRWPINEKIVEQRSDMKIQQLLKKCIQQLEKMKKRNILDGLGDLLASSQKDWARAKLRVIRPPLVKTPQNHKYICPFHSSYSRSRTKPLRRRIYRIHANTGPP